MKLTLEEIWKLADSLEQSDTQKQILSEESPRSSQKTSKSSKQELVLRLPKLQISENWGKAEKVERNELERIVRAATGRTGSAYEKFVLVQEQMDKLRKGQLGKIRSPRVILSKIILLETLNRLFKSFQPAPAGFINEAFLSVFYGSYQVEAGEANKEKDIGDITDGNIPVSVKTKTTGQLIVDGSVENLVTSIQKKGKVYFDIYEKKFSGKDESEHVGSLTFIRFTVDGKNVNSFLGTKVVDQDENGNIVLSKKFRAPPKAAKAELNEEEGDSLDPIVGDDLPDALKSEFESAYYKTDRKGNKVSKLSSVKKAIIFFNILKKNDYTLPRSGDFTTQLNSLEKNGMKELVGALKLAMSATKSSKRQEKIAGLIKIISGVRISNIAIEEPPESGLEREFGIPESHWRIFAEQQGSKQVTLRFSDNEIQKLLENAVDNLNRTVVDLFNDLAGFSDSIQSYLTSMDEGRGQDGMQALKYAKKLEPATEKVVKTLDKDETET